MKYSSLISRINISDFDILYFKYLVNSKETVHRVVHQLLINLPPLIHTLHPGNPRQNDISTISPVKSINLFICCLWYMYAFDIQMHNKHIFVIYFDKDFFFCIHSQNSRKRAFFKFLSKDPRWLIFIIV